MTWAERVKLLRERLDLSQRDLGELLHTGFVPISRWERGHTEPTPCAQMLIELLETSPGRWLSILSEPLTQPNEPWDARIKRLRMRHNISQQDLARALGISLITIGRWERGEIAPTGCSELIVDLLENRFDEVGQHLFQELLVEPVAWDPDRIRMIRESLGLEVEEFGTLIGMEPLTIYHWEEGTTTPARCAHILLWLLETYGSPIQELISSIPVDDAWTPSRITALRKMLGMTVVELAELLGIAEAHFHVLEHGGVSRECYQVLFGLLEEYPENMVWRLRGLPRRA